MTVLGRVRRGGVRGPPGGASRGDAADRHSRHDLAVAPWHRAPSVGAHVAPWAFWPSAGAPSGPVGGAAPGAGERLVGIPADPRWARGARYHGGTVFGSSGVTALVAW